MHLILSISEQTIGEPDTLALQVISAF